MKAYRVAYLVYTKKFGVNSTRITVPAVSEDEIPEIITQLHPNVKTEVLGATELKSWDDYVLDLLWEAHEEIYIRLWEPGMKTSEMIRRLKKFYPALWSGFYG